MGLLMIGEDSYRGQPNGIRILNNKLLFIVPLPPGVDDGLRSICKLGTRSIAQFPDFVIPSGLLT